MPGGLDNDGRGDAHHVVQTEITQPLTKRVVDSITGIGQQAVPGRLLREQFPYLLQRNLRRGLFLPLSGEHLGNPQKPCGPLSRQSGFSRTSVSIPPGLLLDTAPRRR